MENTQTMPLEKLINLEENQTLNVLDSFISFEDKKLKLETAIDMDFDFCLSPFMDMIDDTLFKALELANYSKINEDGLELFATIQFYFNEDGLNIITGFPLIDEKQKGELYDSFKEQVIVLSDTLLGNLSIIVNNYVELKDENKIYSPVMFELIYSKGVNDEWVYSSFVRKTDRPISLQKEQLYELLTNERNAELISLIPDELNQHNQVVIQFISDGYAFNNVKFGTF